MESDMDYEEILERCDHILESVSISSIIYNSLILILIIALWLSGYSDMLLSFWITFLMICMVGASVVTVFGMLDGLIDYVKCTNILILRELRKQCTCKSEE